MDIKYIENDRACLLREELGMEGFGVLTSLLLVLEKKEEKRCNTKLLKGIARTLNVEEEVLLKVIENYGLFITEEHEGEVFFCTAENGVKKRNRNQKKGGDMRSGTAERDENGRFTNNEKPGNIRQEPDSIQLAPVQEVYIPAEEDNIIQLGDPSGTIPNPAHNITTTTSRWIQHVNDAMEDSYWLEMIAMQTKLPVFQRKEEIVELFKRHVIVQGSEHRIYSAKEAKSYFANYTRLGKPTHKSLVEELNRNQERKEKTQRENNPYRYEDKDPATGERSYYGMPIPPETPPRPNENAVLINGEWQ